MELSHISLLESTVILTLPEILGFALKTPNDEVCFIIFLANLIVYIMLLFNILHKVTI
jgi:hypothetical protein